MRMRTNQSIARGFTRRLIWIVLLLLAGATVSVSVADAKADADAVKDAGLRRVGWANIIPHPEMAVSRGGEAQSPLISIEATIGIVGATEAEHEHEHEPRSEHEYQFEYQYESAPTLVVLQRHQSPQATVLPSVLAVSLLSDVLIVSKFALKNPEVIFAIYHAAITRANGDNNKLRIIVVDDYGDIEECMNRIILSDLQQFTQEIAESVDIVSSMDDAKKVVKDLLHYDHHHHHHHHHSAIVGMESRLEFDLLVKQVYEHVTSYACTLPIVWKDAADWSCIISSDDDAAIPPYTHNDYYHDEHDDEYETVAKHQVALQIIQLQIAALEDQQDQSNIPLFHFGAQANRILLDAKDQLPPSLLLQVASQLSSLYATHLEVLRDYHGRKYEYMLDTQQQETWTDAAGKVTHDFRMAAQSAIPELCRDGPLVDADFSYVHSLHGLLSDMMEATEARTDVLSFSLSDDDDNDEEEISKRPAKWYEKLAARAVVLGVNYLQGWLAWQGLRRAAAERDRDMPKFPLF